MTVYVIAVSYFISVESLSSACVKNLAFADIRFILIVPLCDCKSAAPIPKFEGSHMA